MLTHYRYNLIMPNQRSLAIVSIVCGLGTILWLVLLVAGQPAQDFPAALDKAVRGGPLFNLIYLNAAVLVTLPAAFLMAGLYSLVRGDLPSWLALGGLVFVPIYAAFNLLAYLSQVTLVPLLVSLYEQPQTQETALVLLRLVLQELPDSAVGMLNGLAYAVLGIPSLTFSWGLRSRGGALRAAGLLLALNGAACITGFAGMLLGNPLLALGIMIGGLFFLMALLPLTWGLLFDRTYSPELGLSPGQR
jgi:hypothetical protein